MSCVRLRTIVTSVPNKVAGECIYIIYNVILLFVCVRASVCVCVCVLVSIVYHCLN